MNVDELFISGEFLPYPLSKQEVYELLEKVKQNDEEAKEKLVRHNIRLVLHEVISHFNLVKCDKQDLVSSGCIGLLKAIKSFDTSKNLEFSTYAAKCIQNEILIFLRKIKKHQNVDSLDKKVNRDTFGKDILLKNIIPSDEILVVDKYIQIEMYKIIRQIVEELPSRERECIKLHYGFYDNKTYTFQEISNILSIPRTTAFGIVKKTVKKLNKQFQEIGIIELRNNEVSSDKLKSKKRNTYKK